MLRAGGGIIPIDGGLSLRQGREKKRPLKGGRNRGIGNEARSVNLRALNLPRCSIDASQHTIEPGRCQRLPAKPERDQKSMSETSPAPYNAHPMPPMRSFRVGLWAPATKSSGSRLEPVRSCFRACRAGRPGRGHDRDRNRYRRRRARNPDPVRWHASSRNGSLVTDIRQGQVVYYTVKIRNPAATAAHNVVVTRPVPANTRYVAESAAAPGAVVSFSIDGGKTFAPARGLRLPGMLAESAGGGA